MAGETILPSRPDVPKRRGRQRSLVVQAAILKATGELLEKKPLREITADAIARRAGVSKATLYKWWPNKNLIAVDAFEARMNEIVPIPDTGSAEKDFIEQFKSAIDFYKSPGGRIICQFIAEGQSDSDLLALFRERFVKPRREGPRLMWQRGVERGEIRPDVDKELFLDLIYGPMIYRLLVGHCPLDHTQAEAIIAAVFQGMKAIPS